MKIPFDAFDAAFRREIDGARGPIDRLAAKLADKELDPLYILERSEGAFFAAAEIKAAWHVYNCAKQLSKDGMFDTDQLREECIRWAVNMAGRNEWSSSPTFTLANQFYAQAAAHAINLYGTPAWNAINTIVGDIKRDEDRDTAASA